jgi:hypothetical protein
LSQAQWQNGRAECGRIWQNWHIISRLLLLIAAEIEKFPAELWDPQYPSLPQPHLQ